MPQPSTPKQEVQGPRKTKEELAKGLTQRGLARHLEVSPTSVGKARDRGPEEFTAWVLTKGTGEAWEYRDRLYYLVEAAD